MTELSLLLGERIRLRREFLGLSQEAAAFKAGLHAAHYGMIERGKKQATIPTIEKIAGALDVSISELFDFNTRSDTADLTKAVEFYIKNRSNDEQQAILNVVKEITDLLDKYKDIK